jgi:hypothetical protein
MTMERASEIDRQMKAALAADLAEGQGVSTRWEALKRSFAGEYHEAMEKLTNRFIFEPQNFNRNHALNSIVSRYYERLKIHQPES